MIVVGDRGGLLSPTAVTLALLAALLLALVAVPVPAMIDYVNHLARMELLAGAGPWRGYDVRFGFTPNLAMDLIVPGLARVMPVDIAARLFLALTWVAVVSGAMALERVVKGRPGFAGLAALLVLFSVPFAWGLGNSNLGLGLAVWGVALWLGSAGRPLGWRWALHAGVCVVLFFTHFFALGCYGLVVGLVEFPPLLMGRQWRRAAVLAGVLASPVVVLLGLMRLAGGGIGGSRTDWDVAQKWDWLLLFWNGAVPWLAAVTLMTVLLLIAFMVARHRLWLTPAGCWVAGGLLLLYLALPWRLFDMAFLDVRVLALAALVLPAFVTHTPSRAAGAVLVTLVLANGTATVAGWVAHQADYRQFRASFAALPPGAAVLVAVAPGSGQDDVPLYYAPTLAVPARDVFVASFYAFPGAQPVVVAPRYADRAVTEAIDYVPVPWSKLLAGTAPPHAQDWQRRYDYLYVIGPPPGALPPGLREVAAGRRFRLYRIAPP